MSFELAVFSAEAVATDTLALHLEVRERTQ